MHEFAPTKSRPSGSCPSDAELAAYIDGVLGTEEAARVAEHLASCESCYEVYAETVHFLLEPPVPVGDIVKFPVKRGPSRAPWWLTTAAAALITVAGGWFTYQAALAPPPQMVVAEITPNLEGRAVQNLLWDFNRHRGGGGVDSELARQSFQVGALLVDFHVGSRDGTATQVSGIWQKIGVVLGEVPGMKEDSDRILAEYIRMSSKESPSDASQTLREVTARLPETEDQLRDSALFFEYVDLGKWTEAGRISALARDSSFFSSRQNRRFLSYALKTWEPEKPQEVRQKLQAIERIWKRGDDLDPKAFEALARHFQAILDYYDFR